MPHIFDPAHADRLLGPERRKMLNPESILGAIGLLEGATLVDVGCGPGFFTLPAASIVGDSGKVYALDVQPAMVERTRERAAAAGLRNVEAIVSGEADLPVADASADFALLANVLHEAGEQEKLLAEIGRTLRRGGVLGVVEWRNVDMPMGPPLSDRLSPEQVEAYLLGAGFELDGLFEAGPRHYGVRAARRRSRNGRDALA